MGWLSKEAGLAVYGDYKRLRVEERQEELEARKAFQDELKKINESLVDLRSSFAVRIASDTYRDEQMQTLRADLAALQQECRRRWERRAN